MATFTNVIEAAGFIAKHHVSFGGRTIYPDQTVFCCEQIERARHYLRVGAAAGVESVNFNAEFVYRDRDGNRRFAPSIIEVSADGDSIVLTERITHGEGLV